MATPVLIATTLLWAMTMPVLNHANPLAPLGLVSPLASSASLASSANINIDTAINNSPINYQRQLHTFTNTTHELMLELRQALLTKSTKFDESFRSLLASSKAEFHRMFLRTYGITYEHNAEIFTGMYENLERYYATGSVDLDDAMQAFFNRLYQKIFQVLNMQYDFSSTYLNCTSRQLDNLKPFGTVPDKLIAEIKQSFIATRTFVQALNNGIDVIKNLIALGPSNQCNNLVQRVHQAIAVGSMSSSQHQMMSNRPLCTSYCEQIVAKCYSRLNIEFDREWNSYVKALSLLANKMRTSWNIEIVVKPIDIRVSEAIMNMHDNAPVITEQIFQACGNPKMTIGASAIQKKRSVRALPADVSADISEPHNIEIIGKIVTEISDQINRTMGFWSRLPNNVCIGNTQKPLLAQSNCIALGINSLSEPMPSESQMSPSYRQFKASQIERVNNADNRYNGVISQQVMTLRTVVSKINKAIEGHEVDWTAPARSTTTTEAPDSNPDDIDPNQNPNNDDDDDPEPVEQPTLDCPPGTEPVPVSNPDDDSYIDQGSGNGPNGGDDEVDDSTGEDDEEDSGPTEDSDNDESDPPPQPNRSQLTCRPINNAVTSSTAGVPTDVNINKDVNLDSTTELPVTGNAIDQSQYDQIYSPGRMPSRGSEIAITLDTDNAIGSGQTHLIPYCLLTLASVCFTAFVTPTFLATPLN